MKALIKGVKFAVSVILSVVALRLIRPVAAAVTGSRVHSWIRNHEFSESVALLFGGLTAFVFMALCVISAEIPIILFALCLIGIFEEIHSRAHQKLLQIKK